jgi:hypothetical protein
MRFVDQYFPQRIAAITIGYSSLNAMESFSSHLLTLATSAKELEHWVHLNSDCREDLRMGF